MIANCFTQFTLNRLWSFFDYFSLSPQFFCRIYEEMLIASESIWWKATNEVSFQEEKMQETSKRAKREREKPIVGGKQLFWCCLMSEFRIVQSKKNNRKFKKITANRDNRESSPAEVDVEKFLQWVFMFPFWFLAYRLEF